jgi:site-specific DNA recombinase
MATGKPTRTSRPSDHSDGLRFAFYGRTSTTRHQDRVSSQGWQRDMANDLTADHGRIIAAYFDTGTSRRIPWTQRPHAARLMAEIARPEKTIDAIVVGEYERAFTGTQFATSTPGAPGTASSCGCPKQEARSISAIGTTGH